MSKKSEQNAQVRKQRAAQSVAGPGRINIASVPEDRRNAAPAGPFSRLPRWQALCIKAALVLVALSLLSGILSFILPPSVPRPQPFMVSILPQLEIVNQSVLPIHRLSYTCELTSIADQSGFSVGQNSATPVEPQKAPVLYPRQRVPVECHGQLDLRGIRIKTSELKVSIAYFHFGWPFRRHTEYVVKGDFDTMGTLRRWDVQ